MVVLKGSIATNHAVRQPHHAVGDGLEARRDRAANHIRQRPRQNALQTPRATTHGGLGALHARLQPGHIQADVNPHLLLAKAPQIAGQIGLGAVNVGTVSSKGDQNVGEGDTTHVGNSIPISVRIALGGTVRRAGGGVVEGLASPPIACARAPTTSWAKSVASKRVRRT